MDAIEILGDLLGHKTQQSSRGGGVLRDIFGRRPSRTSSPQPKRPDDIQRDADDLEDLLNVAKDRSSVGKTSSTRNTRPTQSQSSRSSHQSRDERKVDTDNERAILLVRAMVNAVKADGKIDDAEQQKLIDQLGTQSKANIEFLRSLFAEPLDVDKFVRSVPVGMEQQVYTMSLIAIDLDDGSEAKYLMRLAEGLRIPTDVREQIHQRLGAASIY